MDQEIEKMERVSGQRQNPDGESFGVRESEGALRPLEWRKTPGFIATEWEGVSSQQGAPTPLEWKSFPGREKI